MCTWACYRNCTIDLFSEAATDGAGRERTQGVPNRKHSSSPAGAAMELLGLMHSGADTHGAWRAWGWGNVGTVSWYYSACPYTAVIAPQCLCWCRSRLHCPFLLPWATRTALSQSCGDRTRERGAERGMISSIGRIWKNQAFPGLHRQHYWYHPLRERP